MRSSLLREDGFEAHNLPVSEKTEGHSTESGKTAPPPNRLLYPVPEVAILLGVEQRLIWKYIETGDLRSVKLGRRRLVPKDAIHQFLAKLNVEVAAA
jgi:excisionase family DNA binding protein